MDTDIDLTERAWRRDKYTCRMCWQPAQTIAYVVPPQYGGKLTLDNVLSLCRVCMEHQRMPDSALRGGPWAAGSVEAAPDVTVRLRPMSEIRSDVLPEQKRRGA
jgi:5-methylcytosine-specific restriction endonuclease McrA